MRATVTFILAAFVTISTNAAAQNDDAPLPGQDDLPALEEMLAEASKVAEKQKTSIRTQVKDSLERLRSRGDVDAEAERSALVALGSGAVPSLIEAFKDEKDNWVREQLAHTLVEYDDPSVAVHLIPLAQDPSVRRSRIAIEALGYLNNPAAIPVLRGVIAVPRNSAQKGAALVALARLGDKDIAGEVESSLSDKSAPVRRGAAVAAGLLGQAGMVRGLTPLVEDNVGEVVLAAIQSLGRFAGNSEASRALYAVLESIEDDHVIAAIEAIGGLGTSDTSRRKLRAVFDEEKDRRDSILRAAARVLNVQLRDDYGIKKLAEPLKQGLRKNPRDSFYNGQLAELYFESGAYRDAVRAYEKSISSKSRRQDIFSAYLSIARCHARLGNGRKVVASLRRTGRDDDFSDLADDPDFVEIAKDSKYAKYFKPKK